VYTGFWLRNLSERDHFGEPGVDGRIILSNITIELRELRCGVWTGSSWFRTWTGGGHL